MRVLTNFLLACLMGVVFFSSFIETGTINVSQAKSAGFSCEGLLKSEWYIKRILKEFRRDAQPQSVENYNHMVVYVNEKGSGCGYYWGKTLSHAKKHAKSMCEISSAPADATEEYIRDNVNCVLKKIAE